MASLHTSQRYQPWSKGKLVGQKAPLKLKDIWATRVRLRLCDKVRDLHCLIWRSIPNSAPSIWSSSGSLAYSMVG